MFGSGFATETSATEDQPQKCRLQGQTAREEILMSVSGISASNLFSYNNQSVQNQRQQIRQDFQQLGQDLQSGNLSAAQSDFATLQQLFPNQSSASSTQNNNPIEQAFNQLSQDLQAGNISAAQQDYSTIQKDFQTQAAQGSQAQEHHHHHHGGGSSSQASEFTQLFDQLGQALQSGNLSTAQQVYSSLQQSLPIAESSTQPSQPSSSAFSATA
jgi:outer membrane protein assembly factor BamD (BamD/ComL family)